MRLRVDLAYDGAPYAGFARQVDQRTVQGDLEDALSRLLDQDVATTCAGRTDRGVHATAQVVHLDVDEAPARRRLAPHGGRVDDADVLATLRRRLDESLGPAITVWQIRRVPATFDARFSATARAYCYRLVDDVAGADPIRRGDRWRVEDPLHVPSMRRAAAHLVGEHDFASFCRRAPGRITTRRLDRVTLQRVAPGRIDVRLKGAAFCHQQVRAIVGCLVEVGRGRREAEWLAEVLAARDRAAAARVAPPHGLTLERVSYGRAWPAAPPEHVRG